MNIRLKTRLVIFSFKKPPKKSFVMKILAPRNPSAASRQGSDHALALKKVHIFRWGTHLYTWLFLFVRPSVRVSQLSR